MPVPGAGSRRTPGGLPGAPVAAGVPLRPTVGALGKGAAPKRAPGVSAPAGQFTFTRATPAPASGAKSSSAAVPTAQPLPPRSAEDAQRGASSSDRPSSAKAVGSARRTDMNRSLAELRARLQREREERDALIDGPNASVARGGASTAAAADGDDANGPLSDEANAIIGRIQNFSLDDVDARIEASRLAKSGSGHTVQPPTPPRAAPPAVRSPAPPRRHVTIAERAESSPAGDDDPDARIVDLPDADAARPRVTTTSSTATAKATSHSIAVGDDEDGAVEGVGATPLFTTAPRAARAEGPATNRPSAKQHSDGGQMRPPNAAFTASLERLHRCAVGNGLYFDWLLRHAHDAAAAGP